MASEKQGKKLKCGVYGGSHVVNKTFYISAPHVCFVNLQYNMVVTPVFVCGNYYYYQFSIFFATYLWPVLEENTLLQGAALIKSYNKWLNSSASRLSPSVHKKK